jgi:multidrug efflux pump subunit AcrB
VRGAESHSVFPCSRNCVQCPQLRAVNTDQQDKGLEAKVIIDRDTAARLGVAAADIDNALYDAFGQRQVSIMYRQLNQYHVVMEVAPEFSRSTEALQNIYVRASNGTPVPLAAFAHFGPSNTPLAVSHQGQYPSVTLSFNLAPGVALGQATQLIEQAERAMGKLWPTRQRNCIVFPSSTSFIGPPPSGM